MRVPKDVPDFDALLREVATTPERLLTILNAAREETVEGRYFHWDELKYRTPPGDLTHREWWFALRQARFAKAKVIPVVGKANAPFSFVLTESIQQALHAIDSRTHGMVAMPDVITNDEMRSRHLVRSLLDESITSSQIEGASTTRDVARTMILQDRPPRDRSEQMILNNYRTMRHILSLGDQPLSRALILEIHALVTTNTLDNPTAAGRFRTAEEPIDIADMDGNVLHVPPPADELEERCRRLCEFANAEAGSSPYIHPVLRSIILHFLVGYDHPFVDGNGRTARALFYWSMLRHGYWLVQFLSISEIIVRAPAQYGRAYLQTETDDGDLTYFLIHQLDVITQAIHDLYISIERRTNELRALTARLQGMESLNHRQRDLISHALQHPGFRYTYESHRRSHDVVHQTARTDLLNLVERGLLTRSKRGHTWTFTPAANLDQQLQHPPKPRPTHRKPPKR